MTAEPSDITLTEHRTQSGDIKVTGQGSDGIMAICYADGLSKNALEGARTYVRDEIGRIRSKRRSRENLGFIRELVQRDFLRVPAGEQHDWERVRLASCLETLETMDRLLGGGT